MAFFQQEQRKRVWLYAASLVLSTKCKSFWEWEKLENSNLRTGEKWYNWKATCSKYNKDERKTHKRKTLLTLLKPKITFWIEEEEGLLLKSQMEMTLKGLKRKDMNTEQSFSGVYKWSEWSPEVLARVNHFARLRYIN